MWGFYIFTLSCLLVAQGKSVIQDDNDELPALEWPEKYTFQAVRIYLLAGFTEDYQVWRAPKFSRVDYNDGAVKSIVSKSNKFGVQYQIHPESDKKANVEFVCNKIKGSMFNRIQTESILPDVDEYDFEKVGVEIINGVENTFFYYKLTEMNVNKQYSIWAVYNASDESWSPTRYEVKEINTWLGSTDNYEIWEFNNFNTDFNETVFDPEEYCADAKTYSMKHKKVTQNLMFLNPDNDDHVNHAFNAFKAKHNRNYGKDEHELRKSIFKKNMRLISRTNRKKLGYKLTINQFADRTEAELTKHKGLMARPKGKVGSIPFPYNNDDLSQIVESLPKEYDTRLYGLVSPVKNQETCGSCWTFGTTASMEGALARSTGKLIALSNQALVDCAWAFGAVGCDGGTDNAAYEWMINYGLPTEAEYGTYTNSDGVCHINNMTKTYPIKGFTDVSPYSENALKVALVNHGPLSVSVNANSAFLMYSSGIFYDPECTPSPLTHEVTLVGYGEEDGQTFWILKNSWGKNWGLDGYMHISSLDNNCGVTAEPTYVVL